MNRAELGRKGEKVTLHFLRRRRYRILQTNYRSRYGEIDIIARDGDTLAFIEVKTRQSLSAGYPQDAVTGRKRSRIVRTAQIYLGRVGGQEENCRFDVVSLMLTPDGGVENIDLIKDAFQMED